MTWAWLIGAYAKFPSAPSIKGLVTLELKKHEKKLCNDKAQVMAFSGELTSEVQEAG